MTHAALRRDQQLVTMFMDMLAAERGAAKNTLAAYGGDLADYLTALHADRTDLTSASTESIRRYIGQLSDAGLAASSAARKLSAIRQLHRFLFAEGHRGDDPTQTLASPKRGRPLPKVLSVQDVERLLSITHERAATAQGSAREPALRMAALMELLYATGLRVSELITLPAGAIGGDTQMLAIRGKGGRERLVPLNGKAREAVQRWRQWLTARENQPVSAWLFPASGSTGHLARQVFARDLKTLASAAGLSSAQVSPHVLRHAFASHLLQNGADLRTLQQLLGHADIATTQIYTHVLDDRVRSMVRDLHPMSKSGEDEY